MPSILQKVKSNRSSDPKRISDPKKISSKSKSPGVSRLSRRSSIVRGRATERSRTKAAEGFTSWIEAARTEENCTIESLFPTYEKIKAKE